MTQSTRKSSGADAFASLIAFLNGDEGAMPTIFEEPAFDRLRQAIKDESATPRDRAVLLRQALRFESLRRGSQSRVQLDPSNLPVNVLRESGLVVSPGTGTQVRVEASPWHPKWLSGAELQAVDEVAMRAEQKRFHANSDIPSDPFLSAIGLHSYRSTGQRTAVRAAIAMPPNSKLIIDLPTGEGKSAVFRIIDAVGFASDPVGSPRGTTLVIVPTVTLALDHERTCGGTVDAPLAYVGGRDGQNNLIKAAIQDGRQGLCFAGPEAALGPLSSSLGMAVQQGKIKAIVIDEAHLIEAWGTGFRTEFQTFAAQCRRWIESTVQEFRFRILFLSATLSSSARTTLVDLFGDGDEIPMVSGAKIRPEPEYWVAPTSDSRTREYRIEEALDHLPRPAIVYVTKVADARALYQKLRAHGYGRIEVVHGETPNQQREAVLNKWAEGTIDLVVATSAFGLGVDYAHVRTIVHLCVPETFDRFYQEVGRAGRDGRATISLLLPIDTDTQLAKSLNRQTVISVERGLQRWCAMFKHQDAISLGHPHYRIRLDAAPGLSEADIDLVGERSQDWNARLLVLMARSGLIRILGPASRPPSAPPHSGPWFDIEVVDDGHMQQLTWNLKTQPKREEIATGAELSLRLMRAHLTTTRCPGRLAAELYGQDGRPVAMHCSGCHVCRSDPTARSAEGIVGEQKVPWPLGGKMSGALTSLVGPSGILVVEMPEVPPGKANARDLAESVRRLDRYGLRLYVAVSTSSPWWDAAVKAGTKSRPWVVVDTPRYSPFTWPRGARMVRFGDDTRIQAEWFQQGSEGCPTIAMVPFGVALPDQPHRLLTQTVPGPVLTFWDFVEKLLI